AMMKKTNEQIQTRAELEAKSDALTMKKFKLDRTKTLVSAQPFHPPEFSAKAAVGTNAPSMQVFMRDALENAQQSFLAQHGKGSATSWQQLTGGPGGKRLTHNKLQAKLQRLAP